MLMLNRADSSIRFFFFLKKMSKVIVVYCDKNFFSRDDTKFPVTFECFIIAHYLIAQCT